MFAKIDFKFLQLCINVGVWPSFANRRLLVWLIVIKFNS